MNDPSVGASDAQTAAGAAKRKKGVSTRSRFGGLEGKRKRVKKAETDPAPSPSAEAMMTWLAASGAFVDGIRVEARGSSGRCLVAARDLPGGTVILRLPHQCALSPERCIASPLGCRIKEKYRLKATLEEEEIIADAVTQEGVDNEEHKEGEEETEFVTYRSVLYAVLMTAPEDDAHCGPFLAHLRAGMCGTPYTWSPADRARLPLEVSKDIENYEAHIIGQYNMMFPSLSEALPDLFPAASCTEDAWRLAHSIYTSHAFPADPVAAKMQGTQEADGVLLPLLDCMNHDSEAANVEWLGLGLEEGCGARVTRPVVEGEELLYSYGCKGNAELIIGYGFAVWDNLHEVVNLRFDLSKYLAPSDSAWPAAAARLEAIADTDGVDLRGAGDISVSVMQEDLDEACALADAASVESQGGRLGLMPQKLTSAALACAAGARGEEGIGSSGETPEAGNLQVLTPAARKLLRDVMLKKGEALMRKCRGSPMGPVAWGRYERNMRNIDAVKVGSHDCAVSPEGCAVALRTAQLQVLVAALDLLQEEEVEAEKAAERAAKRQS